MRVSTQIAAGYFVAVAAVAIGTALSYAHVTSVGADLREIAEEWRELEAVSAALSAVRHDGSVESRESLQASVRKLTKMAADTEAQGGRTEPQHEAKERALLADLARQLLRSADATPAEREAIEKSAVDTAIAFWTEDHGRVEQRIYDIERHQRRLRRLILFTGMGLVFLPLALFLWQLRRILRPLSATLRRVEEIGGTIHAGAQSAPGVDRLAAAVDEMAKAVEARRRDLEHQVETRTHQLRHADRLGGLGRIAAAVAHEINNPLGSIGLCVEAMGRSLREDPLRRDEIRSHLDTVAAEIGRCKETTRKLLSYAHYHPTERMDVPALPLAEAALDLVRAHAKRGGVRLELHTNGDPGAARGDAAQLRQVLLNLLLNAIHASTRGDRVDVDVAEEVGQILFRIRDHGCGISDADRDKVFHPFFTTKRPGEGTGLGLSIAREIVESHGGSLDLEAGPGTVFVVRLPKVESA